MRSIIIWKWILIGASVSYFFLHPFVMILGNFMMEADLRHTHSTTQIIASQYRMSFSLKMFPWALGFAIFGALIGLFYGLIKQAHAALEKEKAFSDRIFDSSQTGMMLINNRREIIRINEAALRMIDHNEKDVVGKLCHSFLCPSTVGRCPIIDLGEQADKSERVLLDKDGKEIPVIKTVGKIEKGGEICLLECFVDIRDRKRVEETLRQSEERYRELSITDGLTNLYNSRHFYERLKSELDRANRYNHPLSLLLMDIDNFKKYNDTYGHLQGDKVLVTLGNVIKRCLRTTDSAYRYGGEEFTVILPETEGKKAIHVAERIRRGFEAETFYPKTDETVFRTVSIGVTQYQPGEEIEVLVKRADKAMYLAKEQGRNQTFLSK